MDFARCNFQAFKCFWPLSSAFILQWGEMNAPWHLVFPNAGAPLGFPDIDGIRRQQLFQLLSWHVAPPRSHPVACITKISIPENCQLKHPAPQVYQIVYQTFTNCLFGQVAPFFSGRPRNGQLHVATLRYVNPTFTYTRWRWWWRWWWRSMMMMMMMMMMIIIISIVIIIMMMMMMIVPFNLVYLFEMWLPEETLGMCIPVSDWRIRDSEANNLTRAIPYTNGVWDGSSSLTIQLAYYIHTYICMCIHIYIHICINNH